MKSIIAISLIAAALFGTAGINAMEDHKHYTVDRTLSGHMAVVEHSTGKLGLSLFESKIVGYFISGRPRVVGFDCKGHSEPMIAMEEDLLPECSTIEPIRYAEER